MATVLGESGPRIWSAVLVLVFLALLVSNRVIFSTDTTAHDYDALLSTAYKSKFAM